MGTYVPGGDHGCQGLDLYIAYVYIYIAELIAVHEIKSAMDIAMNWETQAVNS